MKKFYFAATSVILALSAAFLGYGMYLNSTNDSHIETMLASRAVSLSGVTVSYRELYPELELEYITLQMMVKADAIAEIDGTIEEFYVKQEQEIKQGQPLCKIVNKDAPLVISKADTGVVRAEAVYVQSVSTVERNRRLAAEEAIAASELEMSVSDMKAAKADLDAARIARKQAEQQVSYQTVTAPLSGTVIVLYQQPGNFIDKGAPVVLIADYSSLSFSKMIPDEKIRNITPAEGKFSLRTSFSSLTEKAFNSSPKSSFSEDTAFDVEISGILPPLSENVPFRNVTCRLDNSLKAMEPGMCAGVVIRKETPKRALAIPRTAVFHRDGPKVYVRGADSNLAVRDIKTGVYDAGYVEVIEGLEAGDVVIMSEVAGLTPGIRIEVKLEEELL